LNANDAAATAKHTDLTAAKILFAQTAKGQGVLTNDKALVERLQDFVGRYDCPDGVVDDAADRICELITDIEAQAAEIERLREALGKLAPMVDWMPHPDCVEAEQIIRAALGEME